MDYILKMPYKSAFKLITKANEENSKENMFKLYAGLYPNMKKENFISFDEFLNKTKPKPIMVDTQSKDELIAKVISIENYVKSKST